jgi:hypothetical protein
MALDVPVESLLPSIAELAAHATGVSPQLDLEGYDSTTQDFVSAAVRRATGG